MTDIIWYLSFYVWITSLLWKMYKGIYNFILGLIFFQLFNNIISLSSGFHYFSWKLSNQPYFSSFEEILFLCLLCFLAFDSFTVMCLGMFIFLFTFPRFIVPLESVVWCFLFWKIISNYFFKYCVCAIFFCNSNYTSHIYMHIWLYGFLDFPYFFSLY